MGSAILVFGKSGQVAQAIAELATEQNLDVEFLGRDYLDLSYQDPTATILERRPSAIINASAHTAVDRAESEPDAAMRLNRDAPASMAAAAQKLDIPFVHISTDYVFDGSKTSPYVETDPVNPLGVYGRSKAEGEAAIQMIGGRWTIFRTAWVVAPRGANFINTMKRLAEERERVRVVNDQYGRPTLAKDIAGLCLEATSRGQQRDPSTEGIFHLAGADDANWADIAEYVFVNIGARTGRRPILERISTQDYPTPAPRPKNSRLDTSKLQAVARWCPRPWRDTVDLCLK